VLFQKYKNIEMKEQWPGKKIIFAVELCWTGSFAK
jgi:hypothetical protein